MPPKFADMKDFEAFCKSRAVALHEHILRLPAERCRGQPWALVKEIEEFANSQDLPMIFRESKLRLAQATLADVDPKPKTLVEFGTFVGNSAIAWGAIMKELHPGDSDGIHIYSFELDPEMAKIARDLVRLAGLEDVVTILEGAGAESLKSLVAEGKIVPRSIDAVFFDHWENIYLPDLRLCEELKIIHKGSVIMADNTDFPGAPEYLAYVQKGGSNEPGAVRYESKTLMVPESAQSRGPKALETTTVISV
ncbi:S-adenosyl-L-methionine-dependent methyltransferase [Pestalotiopsis sp. NC0098]|nr:S-adenosyl-L-methionine-dependent methyltransferase [Pestalotiopsis sp. NC0098]